MENTTYNEFEENSYQENDEETVDLEENLDEDNEESQEEEPIDEREEKKRLKTRSYIRNLKRTTERTLNENQILREELEKARSASGQLSSNIYSQYEENARLRIKNAQMAWKEALEESDSDKILKAQEELSRSTASLELIQLESARQNAMQKENYQQRYYEEDPTQRLDPRAKMWIKQNSWYDQYSSEFDYEKAIEVDSFAAQLNKSLINQGLEHEINSPRYFQKINRYAQNYDQENYLNSAPIKPQKRPVSSVRNVSNHLSGSKQKVQIKLTPEEIEMASIMKITPEEYLKYKVVKK